MLITGGERKNSEINKARSKIESVQPVQPDQPFWTNSFIGVPFLYNFVILVGRVGQQKPRLPLMPHTEVCASTSVPIDAKSDLDFDELDARALVIVCPDFVA